jgi:hypothetical protein
MTVYETAVRRFRARFLLNAVLAAQGNFGAAARVTGVHRNTLTRVLSDAGFTARAIRAQLKRDRIAAEDAALLAARKSVQRETLVSGHQVDEFSRRTA